MSKFCKNCGGELNDNDVFCANCGAKQDAEETVNNEAEQQNTAEEPKAAAGVPEKIQNFANKAMDVTGKYVEKAKKDPKIAIMGIGAVVAVLVLVIVLSVVFSGPAYKGAIDNYYAVSFKGEYSKMEKLAPKEVWEYMEDEYDFDLEDQIEELEDSEYYDSMMEMLEEFYGDNVRMSYKITDEDKLSEKKLDAIRDGLKENYGIAKKTVTEGYKVEVEVTIKGSDDEDSNETDLNVVKISGKWYIVSASGDFDFDF